MFIYPTTLTSTRRIAPVTLSRAINHLFNDRYDSSNEPRVPALDVVESDTAYTLTLDLPGLAKDQVKVTVQGRRVSIEAAKPAVAEDKKEAQNDGERVLYRERSKVAYARTVSLPAEVDQTTSSAKFENGVLTLVLAKRVPTGATQLSIN